MIYVTEYVILFLIIIGILIKIFEDPIGTLLIIVPGTIGFIIGNFFGFGWGIIGAIIGITWILSLKK
jgi:hypothetical protein